MLFGPFENNMCEFVSKNVTLNIYSLNVKIVKILSIPDEEYFSETPVGLTATYFIKILGWSRWLCKHPLI